MGFQCISQEARVRDRHIWHLEAGIKRKFQSSINNQSCTTGIDNDAPILRRFDMSAILTPQAVAEVTIAG